MYPIKRTKADAVFDACNISLMVIMMLLVLYPLYFIIIASISEPVAVASGQIVFKPVGFTLEAYTNVLKNSQIFTGYRNTIFYATFGMIFTMSLTVPMAYVRSKRYLPGRKFFTWYFLIPMYFGGGLIPFYLQMKTYNLLNQPYTMIVIGGVSLYYAIVTRTYFQSSIPEELYESARIDGASEFRQFFQIALPLAKPILAVLVLFFVTGRWNSYFDALLYISNPDYYPLQLVLRNILLLNQSMISMIEEGGTEASEMADYYVRQANMAQTMKYALIFISSAPLLAAYPFVQKYFVKGVMIGSIKG